MVYEKVHLKYVVYEFCFLLKYMVFENVHLMYMVFENVHLMYMVYENVHLKYMVYENGL